MTSLGYSSVPGANQILQPTGLANPSNSHFNDPYPQFSSEMGATAGCIGPTGGSASSLNANPGYNIEKQTGGNKGPHVRGGYKKRYSKANKSNANKSNAKKSNAKKSNAKKSKKAKSRKHAHARSHRRGKRSMRGGLSSLSPAPFSGGANAPYHQFTGGEPVSFNYGIGSATPLPLNEIGTAPNHMMNVHNNCGSDHALVNFK
jgi:hypothetical protein